MLEVTQESIGMDKELWKKFRIKCIDCELEYGEAVLAAIHKWAQNDSKRDLGWTKHARRMCKMCNLVECVGKKQYCEPCRQKRYELTVKKTSIKYAEKKGKDLVPCAKCGESTKQQEGTTYCSNCIMTG